MNSLLPKWGLGGTVSQAEGTAKKRRLVSTTYQNSQNIIPRRTGSSLMAIVNDPA